MNKQELSNLLEIESKAKQLTVSDYGDSMFKIDIEYQDGFVGSRTFDLLLRNGFRVISIDTENSFFVVKRIC